MTIFLEPGAGNNPGCSVGNILKGIKKTGYLTVCAGLNALIRKVLRKKEGKKKKEIPSKKKNTRATTSHVPERCQMK